MVDVVFLMNSDVKTLNFCSPTIEKVLLQLHHISREGKRGVGGGGCGDGGEQMLKGIIFLDSVKGG